MIVGLPIGGASLNRLRQWKRRIHGGLSRILLRCEPAIYGAAALGVRRGGGTNHHVLIAAPGGGSVGDQAMLEAFLNSVTGNVVVIVRRNSDVLRLPQDASGRVHVRAMTRLLYGGTLAHLGNLRAFIIILRGAISLSVVGADIMDGAYNSRASERRFRLASIAANRRINSRILGFSWNSHPSSGALTAMQDSADGLQLMARDPESAKRLRRDGGKLVRDVADLAFLVDNFEPLPAELGSWCDEQTSAGRPIVIVNANYLLEKYFDQVGVFSRLINSYTSELSFVLVPNDSRSARSDAAIGADLHESLDEKANVFLLEEPLAPGAVMTLASRALAAISGRMHLTILCANAGTPTLAISYQGKIEGLYERLGSDYFLDPTEEQFAESLGQKFSEFLSNTEALSRRLLTSHTEIRELAALNVSGLNEAPQ